MCFCARQVVECRKKSSQNLGDGSVARNIAVALHASLVVHKLGLQTLKVGKQLGLFADRSGFVNQVGQFCV